MGRTEGKNGSFSAKRMTIHKKIFFHDPVVDLKKGKEGPEAIYKFLIVMCICGRFATITVLRGTHCALLYLKTKTLNIIHFRSFLGLFQKVQVSG